MFSGLQIDNMYTCKTYIFGHRIFYVCKCKNLYNLFVGVLKGLRQELVVEYSRSIDAVNTRAYEELLQHIYSWSP